ncbi:Dual specificity protein phosphatase [uncultured virus]|nr:Dual specificity protein phosphatase [uncultured virus]
MFKYIYAFGKIAYDKTYDYFVYYLPFNYEINDETKNVSIAINDDIKIYDNYLQIEKYEDEKGNKRILPKVGYYEEYLTFFSCPTHIIDNLYLGSAFNAASFSTLKELNIKVILNITSEISNYFPEDFEYIKYNLYDDNQQSITKYLDKSYEDIIYYQKKIQDANILIHCYMGASRSASVIIYYLMKTQKKQNGEYFNFDDALEYVKLKRNIINPTFRLTKDLAKSMINRN